MFTAGQISNFGTNGSTGAFRWAPYGDVVFLKTGTEEGMANIYAYNTSEKSIWTIPSDTEVESCVNFSLTCFKDGGGAFFLSA